MVEHSFYSTIMAEQQVKAAFINFKDLSSYVFSTSSKIDYLTGLFFTISHRFNNNPPSCLNLLYFSIKWQKESTC